MYFSAPLASVILNLLCWVRFLKAWITSDIKFELSGINNLGSSVFLALLELHSQNFTGSGRSWITLIMIQWPTGFAAGKNYMKIECSWVSYFEKISSHVQGSPDVRTAFIPAKNCPYNRDVLTSMHFTTGCPMVTDTTLIWNIFRKCWRNAKSF